MLSLVSWMRFLCMNIMTMAFCSRRRPMYSRQPLHPFTLSLMRTRSKMNRNERLLHVHAGKQGARLQGCH